METGQKPLEEVFVSVIVDMGAGLILLKSDKEGNSFLPQAQFTTGLYLEECALNLTQQQTGLNVEIERQFHVYSHPKHNFIKVVYAARGWGKPLADVGSFHEMNLPSQINEEDKAIIRDYFLGRY